MILSGGQTLPVHHEKAQLAAMEAAQLAAATIHSPAPGQQCSLLSAKGHDESLHAHGRAWVRSRQAVVAVLLTVGSLLLLCGTPLSPLYNLDRILKHPGSGFKPVPSSFNWQACPGYDAHWQCGSLEVPLDHTNQSDTRTAQIATVLYSPRPGKKSERTVVLNPGGPGGSGTSYAFNVAQKISSNYTDSFNVLGFDPRGVNRSTPAISCYDHDAFRDRLSPLRNVYYETQDPRASLLRADAANKAEMLACRKKLGDLPRFMTTASTARDMEHIRIALGEETLTAYMVSYGTGLGQTYSQMFPSRVGRMILDGLEFVVDHRQLAGFGWTSLDNVTAAWQDGFIGECVRPGAHCALSNRTDGKPETAASLSRRLDKLLASVFANPVGGVDSDGLPGVLRYEELIAVIYSALYNSFSWPNLAIRLQRLEAGNATAALNAAAAEWSFDPTPLPQPTKAKAPWDRATNTTSEELGTMVICGDAYDAPQKDLDWYQDLWSNMTKQSFISGNDRFIGSLPCRHYDWVPAEVYRGGFNHTLANPLLLIGETYDPATPLRNGERLLEALGHPNARLIRHHGYGHSSRDTSACTEALKKTYLSTGEVPKQDKTDCYADSKPFSDPKTAHLFGVSEWKALRLERKGRGHSLL